MLVGHTLGGKVALDPLLQLQRCRVAVPKQVSLGTLVSFGTSPSHIELKCFLSKSTSQVIEPTSQPLTGMSTHWLDTSDGPWRLALRALCRM
jgi:hypothetical protein